MGKKKSLKNFDFRTSRMKITIHNEFGQIVYYKEGDVLPTLKDCILNMKFGLQMIGFKDILQFNFMGMGAKGVDSPKTTLIEELMKEIHGEDNNGATEGLSPAQRLKQDKVV